VIGEVKRFRQAGKEKGRTMTHILTLEWPGPGVEVELSRVARCEWEWRLNNRISGVERKVGLGVVKALYRLHGQPVVFHHASAVAEEHRPESVDAKIEALKAELGWANVTSSACKWWLGFEKENVKRRSLVLKLLEELKKRRPLYEEVTPQPTSVIVGFFLAYIYSNTDNIQANLSYFDYTLLKKREELLKKSKQAPKTQPRPKS
jgi:hypothetical protein